MIGTAVIIGAGPAGLTCALELLERTSIKPIVLESSNGVGGLSRTFNHRGNRIDIGGHRFFSKSDRVMDWWTRILPIQGSVQDADRIRLTYQNRSRWLAVAPDGPDPDKVDEVMLVRQRKSRILYNGELYDYPLSLTVDTLKKFGIASSLRVSASYLCSRAFPVTPEETLEDFFINRFGRELYRAFFEKYTKKVWGRPCSEIAASWGAQRVKGLSLTKALAHAARRVVGVSTAEVETSLAEQFLYPKLGPGQIWETVARRIAEKGGEVRLKSRAVGIETRGSHITHVRVSTLDGEEVVAADHVFSTMPVRDLLGCLKTAVPADVRRVGDGLIYRDFIVVGMLLKRLRLGGDCSGRELGERMPDNWIYVQEPDVKVGRVQFFNNWSPYLVAAPDTVWLGLEYFCDEGDALWRMGDAEIGRLGVAELERIGVINADAVIDHTVVRVPKAYPAYFGTFDRFDVIRSYLDGYDNLVLLGRNGMHRYNNQDHSMLTAMVAVDNILAGFRDNSRIWSVNTETDYHEEG
jgi:protoporphyrinogen oxidase